MASVLHRTAVCVLLAGLGVGVVGFFWQTAQQAQLPLPYAGTAVFGALSVLLTRKVLSR